MVGVPLSQAIRMVNVEGQSTQHDSYTMDSYTVGVPTTQYYLGDVLLDVRHNPINVWAKGRWFDELKKLKFEIIGEGLGAILGHPLECPRVPYGFQFDLIAYEEQRQALKTALAQYGCDLEPNLYFLEWVGT